FAAAIPLGSAVRPRLLGASQALVALLAVLYPAYVGIQFQRFDREVVAGLPDAIDGLRDRSRLAYQFAAHSPIFHMGPHWHIPKALHTLRNGGVTDDSFAIRPYYPVQFRPGHAPVRLSYPFWQ